MKSDSDMLTQGEIAAALNEWQRRFIADPSAFEREFEMVATFQREGDAPSYGRDCAAYLLKLHRELSAA